MLVIAACSALIGSRLSVTAPTVAGGRAHLRMRWAREPCSCSPELSIGTGDFYSNKIKPIRPCGWSLPALRACVCYCGWFGGRTWAQPCPQYFKLTPVYCLLMAKGRASLLIGVRRALDGWGSVSSLCVGPVYACAPVRVLGGNLNSHSWAKQVFKLRRLNHRKIATQIANDRLDQDGFRRYIDKAHRLDTLRGRVAALFPIKFSS
jgi:hypothetical protein